MDKLSQWVCEEEACTDPEELFFEFDETLDTSVIRVTTYKPTVVQATPLILPVITVLLEDLKRHVSDPVNCSSDAYHESSDRVPTCNWMVSLGRIYDHFPLEKSPKHKLPLSMCASLRYS